MKKGYKRTNFFINRKFQAKFIIAYVAISSAGLLLSLALFYDFSVQSIEAMKWKMVIYEDTLAEALMPNIIKVGMFAILFTGAITYAFSKYLGNNIFRLVKNIKEELILVRDGNLTIGLKTSRDFKDASEELNNMVTDIRSRFKNIKDDFTEVRASINSLDIIKDEYVLQRCEDIKHRLSEINQCLKSI